MRKIYLIGTINEDLYKTFCKHLDQLLAQNAETVIQVEICSEGGSASIGRAIYGRIRMSTAPIHITAYGACYSAATLILSAGHKRFASPSTLFMVHDSLHKLKGDATSMVKDVRDMLKDEQHWNYLLAQRTSALYKVWRRMHKATTYFTAQEALELGLIDYITP